MFVVAFEVAANTDTGVAFGTRYDLAAGCPECGTGAPQVGPLVIKQRMLPRTRKVAQSYQFDVILSSGVIDELRRAGLREQNLREVVTRDGSVIEGWKQILPATTFPPFLPASSGLERSQHRLGVPCSRCTRDGWFVKPPSMPSLVYSRSAVEASLRGDRELAESFSRGGEVDAACTWECFGKSILPGTAVLKSAWPGKPDQKADFRVIARPMLLLSDAVATALKRMIGKALDASPIRFIQDDAATR